MYVKLFKCLYLACLIYLLYDSIFIVIKMPSWEYYLSLTLSALLCVFWWGWDRFYTRKRFPVICAFIIILFSLLRGAVQMEYYFGSEVKFYFFSIGFYLVIFIPFYFRIFHSLKKRHY
jgi:CDP-diglyceride synthetase